MLITIMSIIRIVVMGIFLFYHGRMSSNIIHGIRDEDILQGSGQDTPVLNF